MSILEQFGFDPNRYFLGVLCKRRHDFEGTGQSVREFKSEDCLDCAKYRRSLRENAPLDPLLVDRLGEKEAKRFFLGNLCTKNPNHEFEGTGKSVRRRDGSVCYACESKRFAEGRYRKRVTPEKYGYDPDRYYLGMICKRGHAFKDTRFTLYRLSESAASRGETGMCIECEKVTGKSWEDARPGYAAYRKRERIANEPGYKEKLREWRIEWVRANPEKARIKTHRDNQRKRELKQINHSAPFTGKDLQARWSQFDRCCAYCAKPIKFKEVEFDHFLPMSLGGADAIGNLLPTCESCNSRKWKKDPLEWYSQQPFYTKKRWRSLLKVLGKTEANYNQLPLL